MDECIKFELYYFKWVGCDWTTREKVHGRTKDIRDYKFESWHIQWAHEISYIAMIWSSKWVYMEFYMEIKVNIFYNVHMIQDRMG